MYRYDLTDAQWEAIASFFPDRYHYGKPGHPWNDHRPLVNGILWHLHTGAPWPDTPQRYGPWQTVYDRFNRWRKDGMWAKILDTLLIRLDDAGRIDRDLWCVDATVIRASRSAAGAKKNPDCQVQLGGSKRTQLDEPKDHALGRSQGGFGTKVHLVCDGGGTLLAVLPTAGQRHESQSLGPVLLRTRRPARKGRSRWPKKVAADKGYSYPSLRVWLRRHHIDSVIPTRKNQSPDPNFDKRTYRKRNIIERVVGWFKECRALGTRYDKLAVNYIALWIVANIHRLLKKRLRFLQTGLSETT